MLSLSEIFNESYYLESNPEAAIALENGEFSNGLDHFQAVGLDAGLRFSPLIDLSYYTDIANPDLVELSNQDALDHLLDIGIDEGRTFSPFVDLEFYLQANPDIAELSHSEALLHLRDIGLDAGLEFSSFVNLEEYRDFAPSLTGFTLSESFSHLATFYAPEDEGRIRLPFEIGFQLPGEYSVFLPETVTGEGEVIITYSKADNELIIDLDLDGLPYRETFTRPEDISTPYNQHPISVEDSWWQLWINGEWFNFETNYWYDGATGDLIASEFDLPDGPIPTDIPTDLTGDGTFDIPVSTITGHILGSPTIFEGNPDGTANIRIEYAYDQLLDDVGSAGTYSSILPYNLNRPEEFGLYHSNGGIPAELAMNWDDILENIRNNERVQFVLSAEPEVKPDFLAGRPNLMDGWSGFYPLVTPDDVVYEAIPNFYRFAEPSDFIVHANAPFPARQAEIDREIETVFATTESDELDAADPSDRFDGNRDTLFTGAGDDIVDASQATGPVFPGTAGLNRIYGGTGADELFAGRRDTLSGDEGEDSLDASLGSGGNRLYGGAQNDELFAGRDDRLMGGDGDDTLDATTGSGNNRLYGQEGNDTFVLGSDDRLLGGDGNDSFFVTDGGNNVLTGGNGTDAFWIATGEFTTTANTITDFELGVDVLGLAGVGLSSVDDLVLTQQGDDALISFAEFDLVQLLNTNVADLNDDGNFVFDTSGTPSPPAVPNQTPEVEVLNEFFDAIATNDRESFLALQTSDVQWHVDGGLVPISPTEIQDIDLIPFAGDWSGTDDRIGDSAGEFFDEFQGALSITDFEPLDILQDEDLLVARVNLGATVNETGLSFDVDMSFTVEVMEDNQQSKIEAVDVIYQAIRVAPAFANILPTPEAIALDEQDSLTGMPLSVNPNASSDTSRSVVANAYDNLVTGNFSGFSPTFAEDGIVVVPSDPAFLLPAGVYEGREGVNTWLTRFTTAVEFRGLNITDIVAEADRVAVLADIETTALGTGISSDLSIVHWLTVDDGSISNLQVLANSHFTASAIAGEPLFV